VLTADLRQAIGRAAGTPVDPGLRSSKTTGLYTSTAPFALPGRGAELAARLTEEPWISSATLTGPGYLTIRVTREALESVPARILAAGDGCVRSDALAGTVVDQAPPPSGATWPDAWYSLTRHLTTRLAIAAGAAPARASADPAAAQRSAAPPEPGALRVNAAVSLKESGECGIHPKGTGAGEVGDAVAWAGEDAVRFALARIAPGRPARIDAREIAMHVLGNPAYAVRYAHSRAASVPRWAAARQGGAPVDLDLAYQLSWLPERVAIAARRGRPDEFAGYLEDLAYGIITRVGPASNLELAAAARTALAAGLGLLGITAPDRL
jgi:hypothetical protein